MERGELSQAKAAILAAVNRFGEGAMTLIESWERSHRRFGAPDAIVQVPHAGEAEIDDRLFELCRDQLHGFMRELDGSAQGLLLADARGRVVHTWTSDRRAHHHLQEVQTERGSDLSEDAVGTNGLGTVIAAGKGLQIRGAEHYAEIYANAMCLGEPILHPQTGDVLGAVVLSGEDGPQPGLMVPLLRGLVAQMQLRILRRAREGEELSPLLVPGALPMSAPVGAPPAGSGLRTVGAVTVEGQDVGFLRDSEGRHGLRLLGGSTSASMLHSEAGAAGTVQDRYWHQYLLRVSTVLRQVGAVMLVGESGVGKATLGVAAMRATAPDRSLQEIDAVRAKVDGWSSLLQKVAQALDDGAGLVIRGAESLSERERLEVRRLFTSAPEPLVVLTTTLDFGADPARVAPATVAPTIVIPPLRDQSNRIRDLWTALAQTHGAPAELAPAAMQAVGEYHWPGNLREMRHVVNDVLGATLGSPIELTALPDTLRGTHGSSTMIERAERYALLQALEQAGGNRSQAAAILGVSRATIYRKIKGYKLSV